MKLGLVTYQLGKDWDVPTLIEKLTALRYGGVELRTEHAHGVEDSLTPEQRAECGAASRTPRWSWSGWAPPSSTTPSIRRWCAPTSRAPGATASSPGTSAPAASRCAPTATRRRPGAPGADPRPDRQGAARVRRRRGQRGADSPGDARHRRRRAGHAPRGRRRRPPQRLAVLELQRPLRRRRQRFRQVRLRPGAGPDRSRPPARPHGRDLPLGRAARLAERDRVRGLLSGGVCTGVERPRARPAVLPDAVPDAGRRVRSSRRSRVQRVGCSECGGRSGVRAAALHPPPATPRPPARPRRRGRCAARSGRR